MAQLAVQTSMIASGLESWNDVFANAHDAASADQIIPDSQYTAWVGEEYDTSYLDTFWVRRIVCRFDTSGLPNNAIIDSAVLRVYRSGYDIYPDPEPITVRVVSGSGTHNPLQLSDFGVLLSKTTSGGSCSWYKATDYEDITLNATGRSWISKTGDTILALRTSKDVNNTNPSNGSPQMPVTTIKQKGTDRPKLTITYHLASLPTLTTQQPIDVNTNSAIGRGNIVDTGGENCGRRGFCYKVGTSGDPTTADSTAYTNGSFGTGAYSKAITGLDPGTNYRIRAYATNSAGTGYGDTVQFQTDPEAPEAPTNVAATDGEHTDKVVITWTKSEGATGYQVYRDGTPLGWLGDVATYDDTGADAPTITPGAAVASDGLHADKVALSLSGKSANNGTTHTYKVRSKTDAVESGDSETDTGYRGVGTLTYQWQRSAADSDADYSNIDGATTASYNDTGAPADGSGRYYRCVENATGAAQQISAVNRGYRAMYYSSGYIGDVIDCTALVDTYDRLAWTKELPSADQAVAVKIRSSPDESTWSEWETVYSSPCTSFVTPVQRYLEWKATLATEDPSYTPKLEDLSFYWTKRVE